MTHSDLLKASLADYLALLLIENAGILSAPCSVLSLQRSCRMSGSGTQRAKQVTNFYCYERLAIPTLLQPLHPRATAHTGTCPKPHIQSPQWLFAHRHESNPKTHRSNSPSMSTSAELMLDLSALEAMQVHNGLSAKCYMIRC